MTRLRYKHHTVAAFIHISTNITQLYVPTNGGRKKGQKKDISEQSDKNKMNKKFSCKLKQWLSVSR